MLALLAAVTPARAERAGAGMVAPSSSITSEPPAPALWSGEHALTLAPGRLELGLFGGARYGLEQTELSVHPALFFALPHLEVKRRLGLSSRSYALGLRARASYPTFALALLSREGSGGLLPKTSAPPPALVLEGDTLLTWIAGARRHGLVTVGVGLAYAAHRDFSNRELPLLDFPFLYQRFAALYTPIVPRFFLGLEGPLIWQERLFATASARYYLMPNLPDVGTAAALETHLGLEYRFSDHVALAVEMKGSLARYAYGTRLHLLPYVDARVGF